MDSKARRLFNENFSESSYEGMIREINKEFPQKLDFRIAESPVFISGELKTKLLLAGNDILDQLLSEKVSKACEHAVPEKYCFPQTNKKPHFIALDFAITEGETGKYEPKLIELQGFPSLFAFQHYLSGKYKKHFKIADGFSPFFNRLNGFSYQEELRKLLKPVAGENTVLLEAYPEKQKTRIDFELSRMYFDIDVVCLSQLEIEDQRLVYQRNGEKKTIDRIYNRVIFDETERKFPELKSKIDLLKLAEFEWVTHPDWYFRISKFALPFLKGQCVPETVFVSQHEKIEFNLNQYVLKPLFSFGGNGVNLNPTTEDLDNLAAPENFILQKKVTYASVIETDKHEKVRTEIRLLYIWPQALNRPRLITGLARLSRGEMIGVDHNKGVDWVGGSACFFETN
jgi:hypothetical protein